MLQTTIQVPSHPKGWEFVGSANHEDTVLMVWYAGYKDYRITNTNNEVIAISDNIVDAHEIANILKGQQ